MKYKILASVLLFSSFVSAQISINEMKNFLKMDIDKFETHALNKGFEFKKIESDENYYGITFTKGNSINTKYITLYEKFFNVGKSVVFQTSLKSDYILIKNQLIAQNFKLINNEEIDGSLHKTYKNNFYIVELYNAFIDNKVIYEATLKYN